MNQRKVYSFPAGINSENIQRMNIPEEDNYIRVMENENYVRFRPNINQRYEVNNSFNPNIPLKRAIHTQIRDNTNKTGVNKYIRYNNHSFVEIKQK